MNMGIKLKKGNNDFKTWCELNGRMDLILEWNSEKNKGLMPQDFFAHSNKDVYWICKNNHSYSCSVDKRTSRNMGCPYCSNKKVLSGFNDLLTINPELAEEWNYEKNKGLLSKSGKDISTPDKLTDKSSQRVWWKCRSCGHEWKTTPNDRSSGKGCPVCSKEKQGNSYAKTMLEKNNNSCETCPEVLIDWDYENNLIKPSEISVNSQKPINWKCHICGNKWSATPSNRIKNQSGCPRCNKHNRTSFPEQALLFYISHIYKDACNSYTDIFSDNTELDIYIPSIRVGIEYDGKVWHSNERSIKKAQEKYDICKKNHIRLIRVSELKLDHDLYSDNYVYREMFTDENLNIVINTVLDLINCSSEDVDVGRDRAAILKQYVIAIKNKSIAVRAPHLVSEWDIDKNDGLRPDQVNAFSNEKYWWICPLGHSYKATPINRTKENSGCHYCSNHKVLPGFNDLATRYPELSNEWDNKLNNPITPSAVMPGSQKKYWWKCSKGHSYQTSPNDRTAQNSGCPYCSNKKVLVGFNDLATVDPKLVKEWDYSKNGELTPQMITAGSINKAWWKCEKEHSWETSILSRTKDKTGCPFCSNQKVLAGFNDLETLFPKLVDEWDFEKNTDILPSEVGAGSSKKVWWKCKTCTKEWRARIVERTCGQKTGCPVCGYKIRMKKTNIERIQKDNMTLLSLFPDIAKEWDYEKNELKPDEVSPGANLKAWWLCPNGHSYQSWLTDKTGKHKVGCPICNGKRLLTGFNDLATVFPDIAEEWDYDKNVGISPSEITAHNGKKVWWRCSKGHSWEAIISTRTGKNRTGCPYCSNKKVLKGYNDLETCFPELCKEWNYEKNNILPSEVVFGSGKSVWWKCSKGHEWEAKIVNRTKGAGCQICYYNRKKLKVD